MTQSDHNVANADGATVRADLNAMLAAIADKQSGATAPATVRAFQWWLDTTTSILKIRDSANTAWVNVASLSGTTWTPYRQGTLIGLFATKNPNVLAKTAAYTIVVADDGKLVDADATSAAFTVTLPTVASAGDGFIIIVKKTDSSVNAVTIDGAGAETIDGATTLVLSSQYDSAALRCDGTEWHVVSKTASTTTAATQAEMEAASSTTVFTSPGRQHFHPGHAKFRVNFNGVGAVSINEDYGVSSIGDDGVGLYTVNFTTNFSNTNYTVIADRPNRGTGLINLVGQAVPHALAVGSVAITSGHVSGVGLLEDSNPIMVTGWGDFA